MGIYDDTETVSVMVRLVSNALLARRQTELPFILYLFIFSTFAFVHLPFPVPSWNHLFCNKTVLCAIDLLFYVVPNTLPYWLSMTRTTAVKASYSPCSLWHCFNPSFWLGNASVTQTATSSMCFPQYVVNSRVGTFWSWGNLFAGTRKVNSSEVFLMM